MIFGKEQVVTPEEPLVLGVAVDPVAAELYDRFAEGRSIDDIYALWKDPAVVNPTLRQRAVASLSAPRGYEAPYPNPYQSIGRLLYIREEVNGEPTDSLRERLAERPELAEELSQGILYWLDKTGGKIAGDVPDSRADYQVAIRELLPLVGEDTADRLFSHFAVNDVEAYRDLEDESGYGAASSLLVDQAISAKYKQACLDQWFSIASREEAGEAIPREPWERALDRLKGFANEYGYYDDVDSTVYTQVVRFIEQHSKDSSVYVHGAQVGKAAGHIEDESVKLSFALRHIDNDIKDFRQFKVENNDDLALVRWLEQRIQGSGRSQVEAKLYTLKMEYQQERHRQLAAQAAELALQQALRQK